MKRLQVAILAGALALLGGGGFLVSTLVGDDPPDYRAGALPLGASSSPDQIPATPTSNAPPYVAAIKAIGCAQKVTASVPAQNGVLVQNVGTVQLRLSDGALATPGWPLAPGAWIHLGFAAGTAGLWRLTGTRYSCSNAGIPPPHFTLDLTVTEP